MTGGKTEDELVELVREYVHGRIEERGGQIIVKYLKPGSERERDALKALVHLLRDGSTLSTAVRWGLAGLFDPESSQPRKFAITNRRKGRQPMPQRDSLLALDIADAISRGRKFEAVIAEVGHRFNLSRAQVLRIWKDEKGSPWVGAVRSIN